MNRREQSIMLELIFDQVQTLKREMRKVQFKMARITDAEKAVEASEAALEARVAAHEEHEAGIAADLQKQIDDLKSGAVSADEAAAALEALKARLDAFDPDTTPPPTP